MITVIFVLLLAITNAEGRQGAVLLSVHPDIKECREKGDHVMAKHVPHSGLVDAKYDCVKFEMKAGRDT
jgi:hypothetical protein